MAFAVGEKGEKMPTKDKPIWNTALINNGKMEQVYELAVVRHGRWKQSKYYKNIIFCDKCGEPFELSNSMEHWNYCPNCGAKMYEVEQ